jgi:hypothetical protein
VTRVFAAMIGAAVLSAGPAAHGATPTRSGAGGFVAAIRASSITIGATTCSRAGSSPAVTGFHVGERAIMDCRNGVLVALHHQLAARAGERVGTGTITALGRRSITISRSPECSLGPGSPSLRSCRIGDRVQYRCRRGVLVDLERW